MTKTRFLLLLIAGFVLAASGLMLIINALSPAESAQVFPPTHAPQPTMIQTPDATPLPPQSTTGEEVFPVQELYPISTL